MNATRFLSIIILSIICGCGKAPSTKSTATKGMHSSSISQLNLLQDADALIVVDGVKLTKQDFLRLADLRGEILLRSGRTLNGAMTPAQAYSLGEEIFYGITNMFIREVSLNKYAGEHGISAGTNDIASCRKGLARSLGMAGAKWDSVLKSLSKTHRGDQRATAEGRVACEALQMAVAGNYVKDHPVEVNSNEVERAIKRFKDYNARCTLTNELVWAAASNIWKRALVGESFAELANKYNEDADKQADGAWGEYKIADFQDEPGLWKLSRNFRKGYISPPVEADNGLVIIHIDEIMDATGDVDAPDYTLSPEAEMKISRIFLHLPQFIEAIDMKNFSDQFKHAKQNHAFEEFVRELISKAKVEFPLGAELFERAEENDIR